MNSVGYQEVHLWRLPVGAQFEDASGQRFEKLAEIVNVRGQRRHVVQCLATPFRGKPGAMASAFFTEMGSLLYLEGSRIVRKMVGEEEPKDAS
jgi:hypothetical protein